jgi:hypothetical protein
MLCFNISPRVQQGSRKGKWHYLNWNQIELDRNGQGEWAEELPRVVWSHNTTTSRATNFTPFRLLYGEEAVIFEGIKLGSLRADQEPRNEEDKNLAIDTREEDRLQALSNIEKYQDGMKKWRRFVNKAIHRRHGSSKKNKSGKIGTKVGRPVFSIRNKAGGLQIANFGRRRGPLLMESA